MKNPLHLLLIFLVAMVFPNNQFAMSNADRTVQVVSASPTRTVKQKNSGFFQKAISKLSKVKRQLKSKLLTEENEKYPHSMTALWLWVASLFMFFLPGALPVIGIFLYLTSMFFSILGLLKDRNRRRAYTVATLIFLFAVVAALFFFYLISHIGDD